MMNECDITASALSSGLADKALEHYNKVTPWGARSRCSADYRYSVRMTSAGHCHVWMTESNDTQEPVMYFVFNRNIGALTSNESHEALITMLAEEQIICIEQAQQELLSVRLLSDSSV